MTPISENHVRFFNSAPTSLVLAIDYPQANDRRVSPPTNIESIASKRQRRIPTHLSIYKLWAIILLPYSICFFYYYVFFLFKVHCLHVLFKYFLTSKLLITALRRCFYQGILIKVAMGSKKLIHEYYFSFYSLLASLHSRTVIASEMWNYATRILVRYNVSDIFFSVAVK